LCQQMREEQGALQEADEEKVDIIYQTESLQHESCQLMERAAR
jgi:hypothetical protein